MSDQQAAGREPVVVDVATSLTSGPGLIYLLYLASLFVGITALIGVILAYMNRGAAPAWAASHYQFQIRTFWIGLVIAVVGVLTTFVLVGFAILLAWAIWFIVRCIKGLQLANRGQPYPDPTTWKW